MPNEEDPKKETCRLSCEWFMYMAIELLFAFSLTHTALAYVIDIILKASIARLAVDAITSLLHIWSINGISLR